jgi:hypothetical protein
MRSSADKIDYERPATFGQVVAIKAIHLGEAMAALLVAALALAGALVGMLVGVAILVALLTG